MAVVRCPSLPAAINTEKGEDKRGGGRTENRGDQRKKKKENEGKPRERDRELFGEKQGDRNREKKQRQKRRGRATTTGCRDTNATRSTNTAALPTP
jgi:hypothetical protein